MSATVRCNSAVRVRGVREREMARARTPRTASRPDAARAPAQARLNCCNLDLANRSRSFSLRRQTCSTSRPAMVLRTPGVCVCARLLAERKRDTRAACFARFSSVRRAFFQPLSTAHTIQAARPARRALPARACRRRRITARAGACRRGLRAAPRSRCPRRSRPAGRSGTTASASRSGCRGSRGEEGLVVMMRDEREEGGARARVRCCAVFVCRR